MDLCFYCGKLILGQYYYDWLGNKCCYEHHNRLVCASCNRFLKPGIRYSQVEPDRYVCQNCIENEVNPSNFLWVKQQVVNRLIKVGFQDVQCDWINFEIISKKQMEQEVPNAAGYQSGVSILNQNIKVLSHLNKIEFAAILAHELLHSWQMQNNLDEYNEYHQTDYSKKICEGFAQMGSYLIFSTINHPYAKWRIELMFRNEDEVYGIPFKKIFERYKEIGWYGIIREARLHNLIL